MRDIDDKINGEIPLGRYIVFAWDQYYPCGAFGDAIADYDDREAAISHASGCINYDNCQIFDCVDRVIIWYKNR